MGKMPRKRLIDMINRCKYINIVLHICGISNTQCQYMADPASCPTYGEPFDRSFVEGYKGNGLTEVAKLESDRVNTEVESLEAFASRIEGELNGMGIKTEREEAPDWF